MAAENVKGLVSFAAKNKIDFVVVGPEAPLVSGLVDELAKHDILAFGPSAQAAEIEGSKAFMKYICDRYDVPTAKYAVFDEPEAAKEHIIKKGAPLVIKADGLAAGKGVILCRNNNEAFAAIDHIMSERAFGAAGDEVLIEEMLTGEEASFFALVDGERAVPLISAQDHKPAFDGDEGPNTGGMGAYCPAPVVTQKIADTIMNRIITPVIEGMAAEGRPYKGVLYAGLMIKDGEPKVLEFNARFGDPECQPLMMLLKTDMLELLVACAEGRLDTVEVEWHADSALTVVMATRGYPGYYEKGTEIRGLDAIDSGDGLMVFHAGTRADGDKFLANGGRVLGVTARGTTVKDAQANAYEAIDKIEWPDGFCRRDIGWRAIER